MSETALNQVEREYHALPTLKMFHESPADIRCLVGPVGSGKTTAASWELCYYLPWELLREHDIKKTRWAIIRNTFPELRDTTQRTVFDWFPWGHHKVQANEYRLQYPDRGPEIEILFRSCDRPEQIKQFKSLELTGYWIDESIEVARAVKQMLKNRIGRYPRKSPVRYGIETTNPPDVEHETYSEFKWVTGLPDVAPLPPGQPLEDHEGFWQPPRENAANLRPRYYDDLINDYRDTPDWIDMYVNGHPGVLVKGRLVYHKFNKRYHVARDPLVWSKGPLYRGWDNSGNMPAAVVCQEPTAGHVQVLREFFSDRMGIVDFTSMVVAECNALYPDAEYRDWGDPAGANKYSKRAGGFTSNAELMLKTCGVDVQPSEQNWDARRETVERALGRIDGLLFDPSCTKLINGFLGGYHYEEIGHTGIYKPIPEKNRYSHCFVGETPVETPAGPVPIRELSIGDLVMTPEGPCPISATMNSRSSDLVKLTFSDGRKLVCTADHPFITKKGCIVLADALQYDEVLQSINIKEDIKWVDQPSIHRRGSTESGIIASLRAITSQTLRLIIFICTELYGSITTALFPPAMLSITATATGETMTLPTLSLSRQGDTLRITAGNGLSATLRVPENICLSTLFPPPLRGIEALRVEPGTENLASGPGRAERENNTPASFVAKTISSLGEQGKRVIALQAAKARRGVAPASMMSNGSVSSVGASSPQTNIPGARRVHGPARTNSSARLKLASKEHLSTTQTVYDITVPGPHCFYADGILVSNCHDSLQYVLLKMLRSTGQHRQRAEYEAYRDNWIKSKTVKGI